MSAELIFLYLIANLLIHFAERMTNNMWIKRTIWITSIAISISMIAMVCSMLFAAEPRRDRNGNLLNVLNPDTASRITDPPKRHGGYTKPSRQQQKEIDKRHYEFLIRSAFDPIFNKPFPWDYDNWHGTIDNPIGATRRWLFDQSGKPAGSIHYLRNFAFYYDAEGKFMFKVYMLPPERQDWKPKQEAKK